MLEQFDVNVQVYLVSLAVGMSVPLVACWLLRLPLREFLKAIFRDPGIEQFWMRVVVVVFFANALAAAVGYMPPDAVESDLAVLIWNLAEQIQSILYSLVYSMLGLFLPLLISYTILHIGRDRPAGPAAKDA